MAATRPTERALPSFSTRFSAPERHCPRMSISRPHSPATMRRRYLPALVARYRCGAVRSDHFRAAGRQSSLQKRWLACPTMKALSHPFSRQHRVRGRRAKRFNRRVCETRGLPGVQIRRAFTNSAARQRQRSTGPSPSALHRISQVRRGRTACDYVPAPPCLCILADGQCVSKCRLLGPTGGKESPGSGKRQIPDS